MTHAIATKKSMSKSKSILLVEDDPALREMLAAVLSEVGHRVYTADDRASALALLSGETAAEIAVVLLDLGLPPAPNSTAEGIALLREIKQRAMALKVIVLSGQSQQQASLEAIRTGAFDFLAKPVPGSALVAAVTRALLFSAREQELQNQGLSRIEVEVQLGEGLKTVRDEAEERLLRLVLRETGFNINQTAVRLGIKRENIYYLLKKFGISRDET